MDLNTLQRIAINALEDVKAQDIQVYDTIGQSSEFDRIIIASGTSNRQTKALAWHVVQKVKEAGGHVGSVEGTETGEWVLVDLGDIVVHVMVPTVRAYYALEEIWGTKPMALKAPIPAAKKTAKSNSKKTTAKKAVAKKTAAKKTPTASKSKKTVSEKSAVKKTAKKSTAQSALATKRVRST